MTERPRQYGPFQILESVGSGGMGEVYRARDPRLNRDVAIKVLAHAGSDPVRQQRLTDEAQAASALNHPNIVTVYDVGVQDGVPFIVSELIDGSSLRALLARAPLGVREVLDVGVQMAEGLAAAHQADIVHRDFKPENVMMTREGRVKIVDFGLAIVGAQPGSSGLDVTLTHELTIQGTVPYMSPEQARGAPVDYRTDQFSLGLTLYEMVTGRRAFHAKTAAQTLAAILEDEPEPSTSSARWHIPSSSETAMASREGFLSE
jgi:eukaryotic-like serine/threonine-protein kinase